MGSVDMTRDEHVETARRLALAASEPTGWGPQKTAWLHTLGGDSEDLETCYIADAGGGNLVVAITGNGPTSKANAEFFVDARRIVLGLLAELDETRVVRDRWRADFEEKQRAYAAVYGELENLKLSLAAK